ncbi:unnamed protein product [Nesidiocoris tenuis]|uniref:Uncharacterized protein n=1 Tax=Nesidiocoris tenuis TaxID=355587 RepID=A0A6H5HGG0_9HEMI|nr:unnamed protein product [Nesidiocoris tenuis]
MVSVHHTALARYAFSQVDRPAREFSRFATPPAMDLDDFFAKKDRKKSKGKKFATADEIAKKLEESGRRSEKLKKEKPPEVDEEGNTVVQDEDEWKEFEEEKKDYSGLKIQNLTIADYENWEEGGSGGEGNSSGIIILTLCSILLLEIQNYQFSKFDIGNFYNFIFFRHQATKRAAWKRTNRAKWSRRKRPAPGASYRIPPQQRRMCHSNSNRPQGESRRRSRHNRRRTFHRRRGTPSGPRRLL